MSLASGRDPVANSIPKLSTVTGIWQDVDSTVDQEIDVHFASMEDQQNIDIQVKQDLGTHQFNNSMERETDHENYFKSESIQEIIIQDLETNQLNNSMDMNETNLKYESIQEIIITPIKSECSNNEFLCKEQFLKCTEPGCTYKTYNVKWLNHHISNHKIKSSFPFDCLYCCKKFKTAKSVNDHLRHIHNVKIDKKLLCEVCGILYRSFDNHNCNHVKVTKQNNSTKPNNSIKTNCEICGDAVINIRKHLFSVHQQSDFKCNECNKLFYSEVALNKHSSIEHNLNPLFQCSVCEQKFKSKFHCESHAKKHTPVEKDLISCPDCPFSTTRIFALNRHRKICVKRKLKCKICNKLFKNDESLRIHTVRSH